MNKFYRAFEISCCVFLIIVVIVAALSLQGCGSTRVEKAQTDTIRQETTTVDTSIPWPMFTTEGIKIIDLPIHLTIKRSGTEVSKSDATKQTTIDAPEISAAVALALKGAMAQFTPGLGAFMGAPKPKDYTGEIIAVVTSTLGLAAGVAKMRADAKNLQQVKDERDFHKNDAAEAYTRLLPPKDTDVRPS